MTNCNISKNIHDGAQGKHIPGHNNYLNGKSILSENPQNFLDRFHAEDINISRVITDNKVKVGFGGIIGSHKDTSGLSTPTLWGIVHSGKNGAYIVPALPDVIPIGGS